MIGVLKQEISSLISFTPFSPNLASLNDREYEEILVSFSSDYTRYYDGELDLRRIKYFPGLLATLFYRVSRFLYLIEKEQDALEFSSCGTFLTAMEIYYSADIGHGLKINHGIGSVIGARVILGRNVTLHHNVTLGDRLGGRPQIEDDVVIYTGAVIIGDVTIGSGAVVGANSLILSSVPSNAIVKGVYNK